MLEGDAVTGSSDAEGGTGSTPVLDALEGSLIVGTGTPESVAEIEAESDTVAGGFEIESDAETVTDAEAESEAESEALFIVVVVVVVVVSVGGGGVGVPVPALPLFEPVGGGGNVWPVGTNRSEQRRSSLTRFRPLTTIGVRVIVQSSTTLPPGTGMT